MTDHARRKPEEHGKHKKLAALETTPSSTRGDGLILGVGLGNVLVLLVFLFTGDVGREGLVGLALARGRTRGRGRRTLALGGGVPLDLATGGARARGSGGSSIGSLCILEVTAHSPDVLLQGRNSDAFADSLGL